MTGPRFARRHRLAAAADRHRVKRIGGAVKVTIHHTGPGLDPFAGLGPGPFGGTSAAVAIREAEEIAAIVRLAGETALIRTGRLR